MDSGGQDVLAPTARTRGAAPVAAPAAVVIPMYKSELGADETAALDRCLKVLGRHPIVVVKPRSLDLMNGPPLARKLPSESFDDAYFHGVHGYNRLMLSPEFYERFQRYSYVLIYQLDAFVFRDELLSWCARGYDYVGAPWMHPWLLEPWWRQGRARWRQWQARHRPLQPDDARLHYRYAGQPGNGGFSLRRVRSLLGILQKPPATLPLYRDAISTHYHEDVFWAYEVPRNDRRFRLPPWQEALQFSIETMAVPCLDRVRRLPFGCHAWTWMQSEVWRPILRQYGYPV